MTSQAQYWLPDILLLSIFFCHHPLVQHMSCIGQNLVIQLAISIIKHNSPRSRQATIQTEQTKFIKYLNGVFPGECVTFDIITLELKEILSYVTSWLFSSRYFLVFSINFIKNFKGSLGNMEMFSLSYIGERNGKSAGKKRKNMMKIQI